MTEQQLARLLIKAGLVSPQQVRQAAKTRPHGVGIAQALVDSGAVMATEIIHVEPGAFTIGPQAASTTNTQSSTQLGVGVTAQAAKAALQTLEREEQKIDRAAHAQVGLGTGAAPTMDDSGVAFDGEGRGGDLEDPVQNTIVIYCNELLKIAVSLRASDMHLEPREGGLLPRYRVDGQLRSGEMIPKDLQPPIVSRFKVLANLDITENRLPQDGRFRATIGGHVFDFRVSSLPSIHGEKIVMRLLDRTSLVTDLTKLGFAADSRQLFSEMLQRSYGMILVTGPTGSGKTTTLYAALASASDETKNVITVEDPVEYELEGVTQTSVQTEIDLTFATQLRAILRKTRRHSRRRNPRY
jgi:type II secretory ATPase GspE/PulE/Tfp pilus assembly ATPase PilB-like protein